MDWKAAYEQQQEARWRVFLMFVVMAVMVIRSGLVSRELRGRLTFFPTTPALKPPSVPAEKSKLSPGASSSPSPAEIQQATLILLCLAEAAGQLVIVNTRAVWELMNQPLSQPAQERPLDADSLCEHPAQRLDTS